jgi:NADPH:quinone reductase
MEAEPPLPGFYGAYRTGSEFAAYHLRKFIREEAMQAIRVHEFGEPEVLKLESVPDLVPGVDEVLVKVHTIGVNPVETYIRTGKYGPMQLPYTPGNDSAGVVRAVGKEVRHFKAGDRVYTSKTESGSYAELTIAKEENVHPLPAKATFQQGASLGTAGGTALRAVFQRGWGIAGETILIQGATGGVGSAAVQLARAMGMRVIATSGSEAGRKFALEQGAHFAVDHDVTQRAEDVKNLTDGKGFDLIVEMMANRNLASDLSALAKNGRVVVVGSRGKIEIDPRETMSREADIRGLMLFAATPGEHRQIYSALSAALEAGTLRPVIGLELPLAEAANAHRLVMEGEQFGKIVLIP